MNAPFPRGRHLVTADRSFAVGGGLVARLLAPGARRALDRIDRGLAAGAIDVTLPDCSRRLLGGRAAGPIAIVDLRSWRALVRLAVSGSVGWYRAWAEGEWASPDPVALFHLFVLNRQGLGQAGRAKGAGRLANRAARAIRRNTRAGARRHIAAHYDLGNDFYAAWLDPTMTYSSAVFADPADPCEGLAAAQARKNHLLLDRLALRPGDRLLEIGCGWGELARTAAAEHGAHVIGLTLSAEQKALADRRTAGLPVSIELRDYRDAEGPVDAVVSVEMVEAVGEEFWRAYLETIARVLKPGGRAALQYICIDPAIWPRYAGNADFIQTYIFPGGMLVNEPRFRALAESAGLRWEDRRGYGLHYAETLRRWRNAFDQAVVEGRLPDGFDNRFNDLWRYYLMYCEGGFRGDGIDVAQVTLVRD